MNGKSKFRAWDKEFGKMIYEFIEGYSISLDYGELVIGSKDGNGDYFELPIMQYTELKDCDGKEIYADDIMIDDKSNKFRVYAWYGGFVIKALFWSSDMKDLEFGDDLILESLADCQNSSWLKCCKIIGNIYKNPELLSSSVS